MARRHMILLTDGELRALRETYEAGAAALDDGREGPSTALLNRLSNKLAQPTACLTALPLRTAAELVEVGLACGYAAENGWGGDFECGSATQRVRDRIVRRLAGRLPHRA